MNDLHRMKKLAGILTEGVMAVPGIGSESNMQMTGNVGRGQTDASFDAAQPQVDEARFNDVSCSQCGQSFGPGDNGFSHCIDHAGKHPIEEKAPPGMEDMVMKLKKEYPDDHSKAFATAWSIYDKKHGKTEESIMNEESYDIDEYVNDANHLVTLLKGSFVEPEKIVEIITNEFKERGCTDEEIANIMDAVSSSMEEQPTDMAQDNRAPIDSMAPEPEMQDDEFGPLEEVSMEEGLPQPLLPRDAEQLRKKVEQAKWKRHQEDDARQQGQTPAEMAEGMGGELTDQMVQDAYEKRHAAFANNHPDKYSIADYAKRLANEFAQQESKKRNGRGFDPITGNTLSMEEAYDMNNGYGDTHSVHPANYFPDGADSPVVCKTGASGARQGDNPEQKKMAVAETHKELVYNYRNYLKESIKTLPRILRKK